MFIDPLCFSITCFHFFGYICGNCFCQDSHILLIIVRHRMLSRPHHVAWENMALLKI